MATNVFGYPVTDDIVRIYYPPPIEITPNLRATVAMKLKFEDDRLLNAEKFVHDLKEAYGTGTSTLCTIFNATGGDLRFTLHHSWEGEVWRSPYPSIIMNGQWAAFLHVSGSSDGHSREGVIYGGRNNDGVERHWLLGWDTSPKDDQNRAFTFLTEGMKPDYDWYYFLNRMEQSENYSGYTWGGCKSTIYVAEGSSPELQATMTLENLDPTDDDVATAKPAQ